MHDFEKMLAYGSEGEADITLRLKRRGWLVLPVYDMVNTNESKKGPRLLSLPKDLVAPDMLAMKSQECYWIECKRKARFVWFALSGKWRTGIDAKYYRDYLEVERRTGIPIWLFFLHDEQEPSADDLKRPGCPAICPTGLFVASLEKLRECEARPNFNTSMVYWNEEDLEHIAPLEEIAS